MATRFRKYFPQCKEVSCSGKRSSKCPETPKRKNGQYKTCGVWCIEFFDDSNRWQSLTFKDITCKTEAERRYMMFISDRERGQLNLPRKKQAPTLREYSQTYLELNKHGKENTIAMKKRAIKALVKHLGDYRLDKITPFIIEKYRLERKEKGQLKDSSLNIDLDILSNIFNMAMKSGLIDKNPCENVKRAKVTQTKDRILSGGEIGLLFNRLRGKDRLMVLTGLFSGMRLNEVLSLKWSNIDFDKGIVTFQASKTGKFITIPLSQLLADEFSKYRVNGLSDRIFEDQKVTHSVVNRHSKYFSQLFKGLGIDNFTFHNLRHTFSSILQGDLGIGAVVVQGMTGHSNLGMLQKYSHSGLDNKKAAIDSLTGHVLNLTKNTGISKTGTT